MGRGGAMASWSGRELLCDRVGQRETESLDEREGARKKKKEKKEEGQCHYDE